MCNKLKWRPAIYEIPCCPKCGNRLKQKWELDTTIDWGPIADPHCVGHYCEHCDILYTELDKIKWDLKENYHPYSIYLQGYMSDEDYLWCKNNNIQDIRDFNKEEVE